MNTLLDLLGSYLIGGFVLVGVIGLILFLSTRSQDAKLNEISQVTISETGKVIEYDFNKLGYRVETGSKVITLTDSTIKFASDLDNNGVVDTVIYSVLTQNNTKTLRRYVTNLAVKTWDMSVFNAKITGLDSIGVKTLTPSSVKGIEVSLQLQPASSGESIPGAYWKRRFFPRNL